MWSTVCWMGAWRWCADEKQLKTDGADTVTDRSLPYLNGFCSFSDDPGHLHLDEG